MLLLKNSVLTIPLVVIVFFLFVMYSMSPLDITSSFIISAVFLFIVCVFISMNINGKENDVFEETLLLHSRFPVNFFASRELVFLSISVLYSLILTIYPVVLAVTDKNKFVPSVEPMDIVCGGAYVLACGIAGTATGDLFHPRLIAKRKDAILDAILISILTVCKHGLIGYNPVFKFLNILLPPIMNGMELVSANNYRFDTAGIFLICLHALVYSAVVTLIKIKLLSVKKFRY
jgi:hypothetical protein